MKIGDIVHADVTALLPKNTIYKVIELGEDTINIGWVLLKIINNTHLLNLEQDTYPYFHTDMSRFDEPLYRWIHTDNIRAITRMKKLKRILC